jgi:Antitoxin ParD
MKTTIEMSDELFRKAKVVAALRGQTLKDLITTAIERELTAADATSAHAPSTDDYLRQLEALAQANAAAWVTGKTAVEAIAEMRNARDA